MATELEEPWKPLVAMILYGGVTILMSTMSKKFPRMRKYLNGTPTILMDHGKLYRENLSKAKLDLSEFMVMCRQQGYFDLSNIQTAIFEYNGILTILPVSSQRPATPNDMSLNPQQELLFTELIMDGRILEGNLKRMGLDLTWLNRQLSERNIHSPREVFLAVCDRNLKLVLFKNIQNERRAAAGKNNRSGVLLPLLFPFPRGAGNGTRAASGASNHAASGAVRACGSGNLRSWRHGVFSHGYTAPLSRAAPIFPTKACTSPQRLIGRQLISASFGFALAPAGIGCKTPLSFGTQRRFAAMKQHYQKYPSLVFS